MEYVVGSVYILAVIPGQCIFSDNYHVSSSGSSSARESSSRSAKTAPIQPISVPAITVDELKDITDNFATKYFIGEGSYGRVYRGLLKNGKEVAIKKLDSKKEPNQELLAQVEFVLALLHYATSGSLR